MVIKVKFTLSIRNRGDRTDILSVEVGDNWNEASVEEQQKILDEEWKSWAYNYIDGAAWEVREDDE